MSADRLRDELRSLPGVAEADIDRDGDVPTNVRVRLHPQADPGRVGVEVQRVLASHGMRSRVSDEEGVSASVVSLPVPEAAMPPRPEAPPPVAVTASATADEPSPPVEEPARNAPPPTEVSSTGPSGVGLASVSVEESADGVAVVATASDGRRFSQRTRPDEEAVAAAVVAVVGALAVGKPPRLLSVSSQRAEGAEAVTVLLEQSDGRRVAGAAVVAAGRAYAVARATWAALHA
jgi:hypothetical protein